MTSTHAFPRGDLNGQHQAPLPGAAPVVAAVVPNGSLPSTAPRAEDTGGISGSVMARAGRRFWWLILACAFLSGLLALAVLSASPPSYAAQARVMVGPLNGSTDSLRASGAIGQTYADALSTPVTLRQAASSAGIVSASDTALSSSMTLSANEKSRIITLRAQWGDPTVARRLATAMLQRLMLLESKSPGESPIPGAADDVLQQREVRRVAGLLTVIEQPSTPTEALPNSHLVVAGLASTVGALAAFTMIALASGSRVRRVLGLREQLGTTPMLGDVPAGRQRGIATGAAARRYDAVARTLQLRMPAGGWRKVVVTADGQLGRSADSAVLNLAAALVRTGVPVHVLGLGRKLPPGAPYGVSTDEEPPDSAAPGRALELHFVRADRPQEVLHSLGDADSLILLLATNGEERDALTLAEACRSREVDFAGVVLVAGTFGERALVPELRSIS